MSRVTCHMLHVTSHMYFLFLFFFGQRCEAYWWRVCYQRGLPPLVYVCVLHVVHVLHITDVPIVTDVPHVADVPHVTDVPHVADLPHVADVPNVADVPPALWHFVISSMSGNLFPIIYNHNKPGHPFSFWGDTI